LLATPVILAAGVLKLPSLAGHFQTRTLIPFAIYCLAVGFASIVRFAVF
jgi:undecaprenyl pyrophosphate phosphatase UppP